MKKFKAIIVKNFGVSSVMKYTDFSFNTPINENQVLIKTVGIGINPVETYIRNGTYTKAVNALI